MGSSVKHILQGNTYIFATSNGIGVEILYLDHRYSWQRVWWMQKSKPTNLDGSDEAYGFRFVRLFNALVTGTCTYQKVGFLEKKAWRSFLKNLDSPPIYNDIMIMKI